MCGLVWTSSRRTKLRALRMMTAFVPVTLGACSTVGPTSIEQGRTPYNQVIHDTSEQQALLNIVRVSNSESPLFMDVTSVLATTSFQGVISGGPSGLGAIAGAVGSITGNAQYQEAPTVQYQPLLGKPLVDQVSTPLTADALANLFKSDWSLAAILTLGIDRLTPGYVDYATAVNAIVDLNQYGAIIIAAAPLSIFYEPDHIRVRQAFCDGKSPADAKKITQALWSRLRKIFHAKANAKVITVPSEGRVVAGKPPRPPLLATRSALGILKFAAEKEEEDGSPQIYISDPKKVWELIAQRNRQGACANDFYMMDPPRDDHWPGLSPTRMNEVATRIGEKNRSLITMYPDKSVLSDEDFETENYFSKFRRFMLIARSDDPPNDAFVSVKQNGKWYYIFNEDYISKRTLALITQFTTILAVPSESKPLTPTISVGARN